MRRRFGRVGQCRLPYRRLAARSYTEMMIKGIASPRLVIVVYRSCLEQRTFPRFRHIDIDRMMALRRQQKQQRYYFLMALFHLFERHIVRTK